MEAAKIAELLCPFLGAETAALTPPDLDHISMYIDILLKWNARINLTAIREPEEIVTRHFGESLFAARHFFPSRSNVGTADPRWPAERSSTRLADLGSGAGFPGIPIKLWAPDISLTLIESNHKKATFLREVARVLTLAKVDIQNTRAETLPPASFDIVTLRAVENFDSALPAAARLIAPSGRLALLVGASQLERARSLLSSFAWAQPLEIPKSRSRILAIAENCPQPMEAPEPNK